MENLQIKDESVIFFVDQDGSDLNPGTKELPFATINGAIRKISKYVESSKKIIIYIRGGSYRLEESIEITGGLLGNSLVIIAYEGEIVRISGGKSIDINQARGVKNVDILERIPQTAHAKVLEIDLGKQGIRGAGVIHRISYWGEQKPMPELLYNGQRMTRARWPNEGYAIVGDVIRAGWDEHDDRTGEDKGLEFTFDEKKLVHWEKAKDVWLLGYWRYGWAVDMLKIKNISLQTKSIHTEQSSSFAIEKGKPFYAVNLLEELDESGEYYIDNDTDILYFIPPEKLKNSDSLVVTFLDSPLLKLNNANGVHISGIVFEEGNGAGVEIAGGQNNVVEKCIFRNLNLAVKIKHAVNSGVKDSEIYDIGAGGIYIDCGDRKHLEAGHCFAENNIIHDFAKTFKVYNGGVTLWGVANRATKNKIFAAPHLGIYFGGNDHIIEYNEIYDVLRESADAGAIYAGRDWTSRGNVIRYNYIHDLVGANEEEITGIYLDDGFSSAHVYGNVLRNMDMGILIGGGRDNIVENNVIIECTQHSKRSIQADARGVEWEQFHNMFWNESCELFRKLKEVPFESQVWSKYEHMADILNDNYAYPKYNIIRNNLIINHKPMDIFPSFYEYSTVENNLIID